MPEPKGLPTRPRPPTRSPALALCLASALGACADRGSPSKDPARYNVLVVVLDAMRADKLSCYGFARETTPNLDALARDPDAVLFERHFAQAPFTKTSTASLFTGLFPFQHGVLAGHDKASGDSWKDVTTPVLAGEHQTMAERLRERGFSTFGVVKSRHLVAEYGFAQGFERFVSPADVKGDEERLSQTIDLMRGAPGRFFGYVHFSACHHPFPPDERDPDYMREHGFEYDETRRRVAGVDFTTPAIKHAILEGEVTLDDADVRFLNLVYEAKTRHVDRTLVGPLLEAMKESGIYDSTLLVVTADHGEELYDHRGYAHAYHVWNEILHVPLIVKFPRGLKPPALPPRVTTLSNTIDVLPTLLEFGGETRLDDLPGASLLEPMAERFVLAEQLSSTTRRWTLIRRGMKLIFSQSSLAEGLFASDGEVMLFDLVADPRETTDLAEEQPEQVEQMEAFARAVFDTAPGLRTEAPVISTELDPEAIEELRQLGYIK